MTPHIAGDVNTWDSPNMGSYSCQACNGSCIVWEPKETELIGEEVSFIGFPAPNPPTFEVTTSIVSMSPEEYRAKPKPGEITWK